MSIEVSSSSTTMSLPVIWCEESVAGRGEKFNLETKMCFMFNCFYVSSAFLDVSLHGILFYPITN